MNGYYKFDNHKQSQSIHSQSIRWFDPQSSGYSDPVPSSPFHIHRSSPISFYANASRPSFQSSRLAIRQINKDGVADRSSESSNSTRLHAGSVSPFTAFDPACGLSGEEAQCVEHVIVADFAILLVHRMNIIHACDTFNASI